MTATSLRLLLVPVLALAVGCGGAAPAADGARPLDVITDRGGDFELVDHENRTWNLSSQRGKVALLYFGYTMCADACPMAMSKIAQAYRQLGPDASRVAALFVSVDRDRDTPAVLKEYVAAFSIPVIGLTGTREQIDRTTAQYRAPYSIEKSDSKAGHFVSHTTSLFLIDQEGRLRREYPHDVRPAELAAGIRQLLDHGSRHSSARR